MNDDPAKRLYSVCSDDGQNQYRLMDASYLVEPVPGLWLLMIDANVFEPRNGEFAKGDAGAFVDSTNAGWNAMLKHKRFVLDWAKDVAARAKREGKQLLAFSHYPMLDMLNGTADDELALYRQDKLDRDGRLCPKRWRVRPSMQAFASISAGISTSMIRRW